MLRIAPFLLLFSFCLSLLTLVLLCLGIKRKNWRYVESSCRGIKAVFLFLTLATVLLVAAFITNDFRIAYVSSYSDLSLPLFYKITGLWAGQKGSLLFWGWLLSLYMTIVTVKDEKRPGDAYLPYTLAVLTVILLFFLVMVTFVTPPFEPNQIIPPDGNGLNPLLQNPGMVFHPPTLYLGYVGFAIPFSFAMAALMTGELSDWWIKRTRAWTLYSWLFLTLGIVFGGWWAYRELGWGGVWAWDPVENVSLLPWLTATAFLHSVMIQERRDMLKVWNLSLIILTFALSIFGAFITRSGIIQSVHAFGRSWVGYVYLVFLLGILVIGISLICIRYGLLKEKNPRLESFISRESSFVYNNILLIGLCFATFWGTIFPLVSEAVKGVKISVGPPFYNTVNAPLFLLLVALMAVCPLLGWRKTSWRSTAKNLRLPTLCMVLSLPLLALLGAHGFLPLFFYALSLFAAVTLVREFYLGARHAAGLGKRNRVTAALRFSHRNRRRYGGYLVHLGIVFIVVGLVGYGFFQYKEDVTMKPGQKITVKGYTLRYQGMQFLQKSNYSSIAAKIDVLKNHSLIGTLQPEKRLYQKHEPTTEAAIMNRPDKDLYLILSGWDHQGGINLSVIVNPLLMWAWVGVAIIIAGLVWSVLPGGRKDPELDAIAAEYRLLLQEES